MNKITVNKKQKLYVIPESHGGYSCLGFIVCRKRDAALRAELGMEAPKGGVGTIKAYNSYQEAVEVASKKNAETGWRSQSELTPQLVGLEGKRVEVVNAWGERSRFIVGKSCGFIPIHLEIKQRNSSGGGAVIGAPFQSIRVL
jgi:hypothetical protein